MIYVASVLLEDTNDARYTVVFSVLGIRCFVHLFDCHQRCADMRSEFLWALFCKNADAVGNVSIHLGVICHTVLQKHLIEVIEIAFD